ncbi:MAG: succinate dehydrogenase/fumarate reductase flavoprotein subunit, partial [Alphaproteobacteria bacterium]|nr:succinate dehydrogenase/fumarate reductase flavoprotein subunit [Alphaproteobacteria bacterium]
GVANSTVFGGIAGESMAAFVAGEPGWREPDLAVAQAAAAASLRAFALPKGDLNGLRKRLLDMMWDEAGIIRTRDSLDRALVALDGFEAELLGTGIPDASPAFNLTWHDWLNLESQITIAKAITHAAVARENSRGAHFRDDFPDEGDLDASYFTKVKLAGADATAGFEVTTEPVKFTIVRPGESLIEGGVGAPALAAGP